MFSSTYNGLPPGLFKPGLSVCLGHSGLWSNISSPGGSPAPTLNPPILSCCLSHHPLLFFSLHLSSSEIILFTFSLNNLPRGQGPFLFGWPLSPKCLEAPGLWEMLLKHLLKWMWTCSAKVLGWGCSGGCIAWTGCGHSLLELRPKKQNISASPEAFSLRDALEAASP